MVLLVNAPAVSLLGLVGTLLTATPTGHDPDPTVITTAYGRVRGRLVLGARNTRFYSFQGIPYARPPLGSLRFKDPQLPTKWTVDPLEARYEGASAPGLDIFGGNTVDPFSSEDCLRLNVFTRQPNTNRKYPVMVFIHGGGYVTGSSAQLMYGPDLLMQKDVVLVTFNYRVGALGFLSVADKRFETPGNAGLKDQAFALLWVRQNIARFGGDPDNVTLFGNSAGASSVHYHMLSPYSSGLFHKAILQSGSAFNPWANYGGTDLNDRLARKLGWSGDGETAGIMRTLMAATAEEIVYAQQLVSVTESQRGDLFLFVPRVEPYNSNGSCIIPRSIERMSNENAWGSAIPIMIGANSHEGYLYFFDFVKRVRVVADPERYFRNALPKELRVNSARRTEIATALQRFYFGAEVPSEANIEEKLVPLLSDKLFWHGIDGVVQSRLNDAHSNATYLYRFSFDSRILVALELVLAGRFVKGTVHSEELQYLFNFSGINAYMPDDSDEAKVLNTILSVWTQFAATGNPNCPATKPLVWEPVERNNAPHKCFNIDAQNSFVDLPETKRISFWNSMYKYA